MSKHRQFSVVAVSLLICFSAFAQNSDADLQYQRMHEKPRILFDRWAAERNISEGKTLSPRERFMSLSVSDRSTFAAVTNGLLYTRLTDTSGKTVGFAIDLIDGLDLIAGEAAGKGGDEQFRLYVRLKPGTRRQLEAAREFLHDKDNTVFTKAFRSTIDKPEIRRHFNIR